MLDFPDSREQPRGCSIACPVRRGSACCAHIAHCPGALGEDVGAVAGGWGLCDKPACCQQPERAGGVETVTPAAS